MQKGFCMSTCMLTNCNHTMCFNKNSLSQKCIILLQMQIFAAIENCCDIKFQMKHDKQIIYQNNAFVLPFAVVTFLEIKNIVIIEYNTYHNVIYCIMNNTKPCFDSTIFIVQQRNEEVILCSINIVILTATWLIIKCLQILIFSS